MNLTLEEKTTLAALIRLSFDLNEEGKNYNQAKDQELIRISIKLDLPDSFTNELENDFAFINK